MKYWKNGIQYDSPDPTAEELEAMKKEETAHKMQERTRPLTEQEVSRMLITEQINTLVVDDNTALRMMEFYPEWAANTAYTAGYKVRYSGKLWRVLQAHTSQIGWEPTVAASLFEQINEAHAGTEDDPIPYDGNMALENGKYYVQDYTIYLCIRDTINPVYNALSELVGIYVTEI